MTSGKRMRKQWKERIQASIETPWGNGMEARFYRKTLQQLWSEHQEGRQDHGARLWAWFVLSRWNERFKPEWGE